LRADRETPAYFCPAPGSDAARWHAQIARKLARSLSRPCRAGDSTPGHSRSAAAKTLSRWHPCRDCLPEVLSPRSLRSSFLQIEWVHQVVQRVRRSDPIADVDQKLASFFGVERHLDLQHINPCLPLDQRVLNPSFHPLQRRVVDGPENERPE